MDVVAGVGCVPHCAYPVPGDFPMAPLVCGTCRECCLGPRLLHISGPTWLYKTYQRDGKTWLAHRTNGDCFYLGQYGCTIHASRPKECREYDCRTLIDDPHITKRIKVEAIARLDISKEDDNGNGL